MTVEGDEDLRGLQRIGRIVARCLEHMGGALEPGMSTRELDSIGAAFLDRHGARSAPQLTYGFPGATCISVNEEVAHGAPSERRIEGGDLVNIDVSAELGGYFADTGGSFQVPPFGVRDVALCRATKRALADALEQARAGFRLNRIGRAIQRRARRSGFHVIRDLCSHGVGRALHEEPELIAGYYEPRDRRRLHLGQVITIEPFLTTGAPHVRQAADGWTLLNDPGSRSAQYEHTLIITRSAPIVVTLAA